MVVNSDNVAILMATFNGENYLAEQIESILNQDYSNWTLIIHDDGSTDQTINILNKYKIKHPLKIKIIDDGVKTGGAKNNFIHLLKHTDADYIMFSDQDDYWLPDKISKSLEQINIIEQLKGKEHPTLVYTDLKVVDENLDIISNSLKNFQRLRHPSSLNDIALKNSVTGCTMLFNKSLHDKLIFPKEAIMHDWWITINLLKIKGTLAFFPEPTILYRQHGKNFIGAKKSENILLSYVSRIKNPIKNYKDFIRSYNQFNIATGKGKIFFIVHKLIR